MKKELSLRITIAVDNNIPAFANCDEKEIQDEPKIILVNFNAMFETMVEEDIGITFKEFFAENVVHEMLYMVQDIFEQAFDEDKIENAIMACRKKATK
ncbi:MAG: hypothetical protein PHY56_00620 [Candidatus Omnitrophica bacterium]|nr:hypothetical protein [Candidatus Omnitrophota bacterium]